jgi:hypothetical protein
MSETINRSDYLIALYGAMWGAYDTSSPKIARDLAISDARENNLDRRFDGSTRSMIDFVNVASFRFPEMEGSEFLSSDWIDAHPDYIEGDGSYYYVARFVYFGVHFRFVKPVDKPAVKEDIVSTLESVLFA